MTPTPIDAWIRPEESASAIPLVLVDSNEFEATVAALGDAVRRACVANGFRGESGRNLGVTLTDGGESIMLAGCSRRDGSVCPGLVAGRLPEGNYRLDPRGVQIEAAQAALGWALGAYRFSRYRKSARPPARLVVDADVRARSRQPGRGGLPDPRPDQHADPGHGSGRSCRRRPRAGQSARRELSRMGRRGPAGRQFPDHPCGRSRRRRRSPATPGHALARRRRRPARGPGRQGRVLRHRRPRPENSATACAG